MASQYSDSQAPLGAGVSSTNGSTAGPSKIISDDSFRRNSNDLSDPQAFDKLSQRLAASQTSIPALAVNGAGPSTAAPAGPPAPPPPAEPPLTFGRIAKNLLTSTFGFNKVPFSFLFIFTYLLVALVVTPVQVESPSPDVSVYPEKYLLGSWTDLQEISKYFHPYSSHANDFVHDYILSQTRNIASHSTSTTIIHSHDDGRKFLFEEADVFVPELTGRVVYFEGNNILVKIQGNDSSLGSVLVSAHYDSVPTAYGTTDDGAGIASMLGILRYYSDAKTPSPRRSIILNFNNNEEFGLLGAQAFFRHPWSKDAEVFLNLEGTGAGGRAILFRATDYGVAKHYRAATSPHMNSIFQQGFTDGYIRSETDYKVYTNNGLRGLDVAFYKPRNLYHTRRDSISGTTYGALSHMFTNALDVVRSMSDAPKGDFVATTDDTAPAVYFDILGQYAVVIPLAQLFRVQAVGIVAGPLIVIGLFLAVIRTNSWHIGIRGWFRGIVSLALSSAATIATARWIESKNELVVISQTFSPLFLLFSIFLLTNYFILGFASYIYPVHDQKLVIFLELFVVLWALLIVSTVHISERAATGEYIVPALYFVYLVAIFFGLLGLLFTTTDDLSRSSEEVFIDEAQEPLLNNSDYNTYGSQSYSDSDYDSEAEAEAAAEVAVEATQGAPKRQLGSYPETGGHRLADHKTTREKIQHIASKSLSLDWSIQFLLVVPVGVYLVYSSGLLTFEALRENAQEGASRAYGVYTELIAVAIVLGVLVLPFVHRLHTLVPVVLLGTVVVCGYRSLCLPAVSHESPIKIRWIQGIDLDETVGNASAGVFPPATVSVLARQGFGYKVLSDLPSVKREGLPITCRPYGSDDNEVCSYEGPRPWVIDGASREEAGDYSRWLNVTVLSTHNDKKKKKPELPPVRIRNKETGKIEAVQDEEDFGPFTGSIFIEAKDSRVCTLTFNTTIYQSGDLGAASPVRTVTVYHDDLDDILNPPATNESANDVDDGGSWSRVRAPDTLKYYKGINDLTVHKLNWTQQGYHLEFVWIPRWFENGQVLVQGEDDEEGAHEEDKLLQAVKGNYMTAINNRLDHRVMHQQRLKNSDDDAPAAADKRALGIEVRCYWGEYDSESVIGEAASPAGSAAKNPESNGPTNDEEGASLQTVRKVPALDEVLQYGPTWVTWTNWAAGLVEVKKYIEL